MLRWIAAAAALAACGNDAKPRPPTPIAPTAPRPADAAAPPHHPFGDARGPIVTASELIVEGASLGIAPAHLAADDASLAERLRKVPAAATLSYTDDAPASAVLAVLRGLFETGHAHVELVAAVDGKPAAACKVTVAPAGADALKIELQDHRADLGLSEVRPVLHRELGDARLATHLRDDLAAPFFDKLDAAEIAADLVTTGDELRRVMTPLCDRLGAWRVGDFTRIERGRRQPRTLPLCRKVIARSPASAYDPELLRAALPQLDAMDLCYRRFARAPGPIGTITMTLEIEPDGTVGEHAATGLDADVNRCIAWLVGRSQFPNPPASAVRVRATAECNTRCCNGD